MSRTSRMAKRLPSYYSAEDGDRISHALLNAFSEVFKGTQKDLTQVLMAHWVDRANGADLDKLAKLFSLEREALSDAQLRSRVKSIPGWEEKTKITEVELDSREGKELDNIASNLSINRSETDDSFRERIMSATRLYTGGGTFDSVSEAVREALCLPSDEYKKISQAQKPNSTQSNDYTFAIRNPVSTEFRANEILFIENPPIPCTANLSGKPPYEFTLDNCSTTDSTLKLTLAVKGGTFDISQFDEDDTFAHDAIINHVLFFPVISCDNEQSIECNLLVLAGQSLSIAFFDGKVRASLDDKEVTEDVNIHAINQLITVPRGSSWWKIEERLRTSFESKFDHAFFSVHEGAFEHTDQAGNSDNSFDSCVFERDAAIKLRMEWTRREPAAFQVIVPRNYVNSSEKVLRLIDAIAASKAAGIKASVVLSFGFTENQHQVERAPFGVAKLQLAESHHATIALKYPGNYYKEIRESHRTTEQFGAGGSFEGNVFDSAVFA